jgi:hypothetical protein
VNGPFSADSGSIANNLSVAKGLSADSITGTTLTVSGASTIGGALTVTGGVDAKSGGFTTTGNLTAGGATVSSLTDTGALTAGSATLSGLTVSGPVDFSHATVTGLSNVGSATTLTVGTVSSTSPPLTIIENGQSSTIGVSNGSLQLGGSAAPNVSTAGNLSVGGNLTVAGSSALNVSSLTAPNASGTTTPGQFTLTGNPIVLTGAVQATSSLTVAGNTTFNGNATVSPGNDLIVPGSAGNGTTTPANTVHVLASGNKDVAGTVTVQVSGGTAANTELTNTVTFVRNYTAAPIVVLTPANDPNPGSAAAAKYWVTLTTNGSGAYTGFIVHYVTASLIGANNQPVTFNYHVIGS